MTTEKMTTVEIDDRHRHVGIFAVAAATAIGYGRPDLAAGMTALAREVLDGAVDFDVDLLTSHAQL